MRKRFSFLLIALIILSCSIFSFLYAETTSSQTDELTMLARNFVNLLIKEDFNAAVKDFDATMTSQFPAEKLQATWEAVLQQVGKVKKEIKSQTQQSGQYNIIILTYQFEKLTIDIRVVYNSAKQVAGLFFAPSPEPPVVEYKAPSYVKISDFKEEEVVVGVGEWALHGTLTIPRNGKGSYPAVVLVQGSGPNDRDETVGANKPFRDLAWGLATQNIAVLRCEKRTREYAAKIAPIARDLTVKEETIDDALAAVNFLRNDKRVNARKIFVLGHSLGGMLIPRIGKADPKIAGFVVLAGPTRPLEDLIYEQDSYILSLENNPSEDDKNTLAQVKRQVAKVKDPNLSEQTATRELPLGIPPKYWLDLRGYDPAKAALSLKQPFMILQGERDYQVTTADFNGWKKVLAVRKNMLFKLYPKLNHLFIEGQGKSKPEEYLTSGHVSAEVIKDISDWITKQK